MPDRGESTPVESPASDLVAAARDESFAAVQSKVREPLLTAGHFLTAGGRGWGAFMRDSFRIRRPGSVQRGGAVPTDFLLGVTRTTVYMFNMVRGSLSMFMPDSAGMELAAWDRGKSGLGAFTRPAQAGDHWEGTLALVLELPDGRQLECHGDPEIIEEIARLIRDPAGTE